VQPCHRATSNLIAKRWYAEVNELVRFNQAYQRRGAPLFDRVEINAQVAVSSAGHCQQLLLARTEGQSDAPLPLPAPAWPREKSPRGQIGEKLD
jgi:hypothetical protein